MPQFIGLQGWSTFGRRMLLPGATELPKTLTIPTGGSNFDLDDSLVIPCWARCHELDQFFALRIKELLVSGSINGITKWGDFALNLVALLSTIDKDTDAERIFAYGNVAGISFMPPSGYDYYVYGGQGELFAAHYVYLPPAGETATDIITSEEFPVKWPGLIAQITLGWQYTNSYSADSASGMLNTTLTDVELLSLTT